MLAILVEVLNCVELHKAYPDQSEHCCCCMSTEDLLRTTVICPHQSTVTRSFSVVDVSTALRQLTAQHCPILSQVRMFRSVAFDMLSEAIGLLDDKIDGSSSYVPAGLSILQ